MKERLLYLDSTRGIASLMVVFSHLISCIDWTYLGTQSFISYLKPISHGEGTVSFFFVLSGFVLTIPFHSKKIDFSYCIQFCLSRFFRIYPLFIFCLLISFLFFKYSNYEITKNEYLTNWIVNGIQNSIQDTSWKNLLQNLNLVFKQSTHRFLPQDWTLSIELIISIFCIIFFIITLFSPEIMLLIGIFGIKLIGLNSFIFPFIIGSYLYTRKDFLVNFLNKNLLLKYALLIISLICFYSNLLLDKEKINIINKIFINLNSIGACGLLLIVLSSLKIQKLLSNRIVVFIGEISYSIYLTHFLIIFILIKHIDSTTSLLLIYLLILSLIILISYLTYECIEKPFLKIGKSLLKKIANLSLTK